MGSLPDYRASEQAVVSENRLGVVQGTQALLPDTHWVDRGESRIHDFWFSDHYDTINHTQTWWLRLQDLELDM